MIVLPSRLRAADAAVLFRARDCVDDLGVFALGFGQRLSATVARASSRRILDQGDHLVALPSGVIVPGNVYGSRSVLFEAAATQLVTYPQAPASWTNFGTPVVTTGIVDPWGGSSAVMLEDDDAGGREGKSIVVAFTGDGAKSALFAVRAGTCTEIAIAIRDVTAGNIDRHQVRARWLAGIDAEPTLDTVVGSGSIARPQRIVDRTGVVWWLLGISADGIVAANANIVYVTAGYGAVPTGTIYFAGANAWDSPIPFSWQHASGHTRQVDAIDLPFLLPPTDLTIYVEGRPVGAASRPNGSYTASTFACIGGGTSGTWRLQLRHDMGSGHKRPQYVVLAKTGAGTQAVSTVGGSAQVGFGQPYCRLALQYRQADAGIRHSGSEFDGAYTAEAPDFNLGDLTQRVDAWGSPVLRIGRYDNNNAGGWAVGAMVVARGHRSFDDMVALAGG